MPELNQYQAQRQQLALSDQMQLSLRILQAPVTELRQIVNAELAANPLLEEMTPESPAAQEDSSPEEPPAVWTEEALEKRQHFLDSQTRDQTLVEFLERQIAFENLNSHQKAAVQVVLGNLDASGYFRGDPREMAQDGRIALQDLDWALYRVQQLDPPGVGARDLAECLLLQLARDGRGESLEARVVRDHLEDLAWRRIPHIAGCQGVPVADVQDAARRIQGLNPRPGAAFAPSENHQIRPDVLVVREGGEFRVELNEEGIPRLRITPEYRDMSGLGGDARNLRDFLRERIRSGRSLIHGIQDRQQTLLAVSREIMARQRAFLERGADALVPLTMTRVARALGIHETTVGRAVSGKYIETPHGVFELGYFFGSGYVTGEGGSVSSEGVRHAIQEMIRSESPQAPLGDHTLAEALAARGISISRRTIAKYRGQLGIPPAEQRRAF